ncbi:MAG: hypothetical protein Q9228_008040, partial [Teloschistes exilis]
MVSTRAMFAFRLFAIIKIVASIKFPVKLEVTGPLDSRSANIHLTRLDESVYPFTVTYGDCLTFGDKYELHHTVSEVRDRGIDRLIWLLPEDVSSGGCLSAWSDSGLVGRSRALQINKNSRQWIKKRHLDRGTRLSKRSSIPMNNASGIDAEGPWFDGVEVLKDKEITAVNAAQAKAKRIESYAAIFGSKLW